jgi:hypothetical protein
VVRLAAAGIAAVGLVATAGNPIGNALGAGAGGVPSFSVDTISKGAEVTFTIVDPLTTPIDAAVVDDGAPKCFGGGASGNRCFDRISSMVERHQAAAGFTANYNNSVDILGLAVVDHHAYSVPDPHTTSLCVGDAIPGATRPAVTITKDANATRCRTAVSGERVVADGQVAIEGQGDQGNRGAFWWSVEQSSNVQRTVVGLKQDGSLLVAVVSATRSKQRNGMTLPSTAQWLISHGVVNAIALDGGHQAEAYVAGRGSIVPLQAGEPGVQVSLLLGHMLPTRPAPPAPAPPPPPPAPVVAPALPPAPTPAPPPPAPPRGPVPSTGVLGDVVLPRLPESGVLRASGAASASPGATTNTPRLPQAPASSGSPAGSTTAGGLTTW